MVLLSVPNINGPQKVEVKFKITNYVWSWKNKNKKTCWYSDTYQHILLPKIIKKACTNVSRKRFLKFYFVCTVDDANMSPKYQRMPVRVVTHILRLSIYIIRKWWIFGTGNETSESEKRDKYQRTQTRVRRHSAS